MKLANGTKVIRIAASSILIMLWTSGTCFAQFETAAVLVAVFDASHTGVSNAHVQLENLGTGTTQSTATDADGNYQFLEVRVGHYRVVADATGFKKTETHEFRVEVGARLRIDATLEVGNVQETVEVKDSASILETDSSERGQVIGSEEVLNLPLNGRSSASLALLAPGVRNAYALSKRESSFNMGGLRSQYNNFILDGVDNNAYGTSNQGLSNQVVQLSPDALQEFRVITNDYSAQYGRVGGGVVNASIRSGTNSFHGIGLGLPAEHGLECGWILQADRWSKTGLYFEPVWRNIQRSREEKPIIPFC